MLSKCNGVVIGFFDGTSLKQDCSFLSKCEEYDDLKKAVDAYKAKKK
jgi:hypothetical protein